MTISELERPDLIAAARCTDRDLAVTLTDGRTVTVPLWWYPRLLRATPEQRANLEIGRFGIHWPEIDEDIELAGLLLGAKAPDAAPTLPTGRSPRLSTRPHHMATLPRVEYVADLLRSLHPSDSQPTDLSSYTTIFSKADEGTLLLPPSDSQEYTQTLQRLVDQFGSKELSPTTIERELRNAVFEAIDIPKKRQARGLDERIESAIRRLITALTLPSEEYECYVPINGVDQTGLPFPFGLATFTRFDISQIQRAMHWQKITSTLDKQNWRNMIRLVKCTNLWQSTCARTRVSAKDAESAMDLARQRVRMTIDIINFFCGICSL